jgi:transposase-like protein
LIVALQLSHQQRNGANKMTISKMTIKFLGKKETIYRALNVNGEVVRVFADKEEADAWLSAQ